MRAAVLEEIPGELHIRDVEVDRPRSHEVLVRVAAAGLCHTDLHFMEGHLPLQAPAVLGHEVAGVVEQVGDAVGYVRPGDHVIGCLSVYCGDCEFCLTGKPAICENPGATTREATAPPRLSADGKPITQFMHLSAFAELMLAHERAVVKIDPAMPLDRAALIGCAVTTGLGAVFNTARVVPGSVVAVFGCGAIGLNVIQGARLAGAGRIFAVDLSAAKLEAAKIMGATDLIDVGEGDPVEQIREETRGRGVHYSFEAIGSARTAEQAFLCLAKGGTATIIGLMGADERVNLPGLFFLAERRIQGCDMGSNRFRVDMPRYIDFYLSGRLKLDELLSRRLTLDQINEGFAAMKRGETVRSVVVPTS